MSLSDERPAEVLPDEGAPMCTDAGPDDELISVPLPVPVPWPIPATNGIQWPWWKGGFEYATATRIGTQHLENEDCTRCGNSRARWVVVADGVGSGALGAVASRMVVDEFESYAISDPIKRDSFFSWLSKIDSMINEALSESTNTGGAATFVAALANSRFWNAWTILWIGDCRAYVKRDGGSIEQLTRDQTYAAFGEKPPSNAWPNDPAFMVGRGGISRYGSAPATIRLGDTLLVCTAGVHRFVDAQRIDTILQGSRDLRQACREIIQEADSARGYSDATIAAVRRHRWFGAAGQYWLCLAVAIIFLGVK